jgi:hypothetical protein
VTPIAWKEIENICKQYRTEAVCAIELFDTDVRDETSTRIIKEKNKEGIETTRTVYDGRRKVRVDLGWRLYDPKTRSIIDEYRNSDDIESTSSSEKTPQLALCRS